MQQNEEIAINSNALKILRNQKGLTQSELAQIMEYDQSYISRAEAGQTGISLDYFIKLCRVFEKRADLMCDVLGIKIH